MLQKQTIKTNSMSAIIPWLICGVGALFYCYEYFLRVTPSVMKADLMSAFTITNSGFGLLAGLYYYAYTPLQLPVGVLMDRYGPRRLLTLACLICVIGTYLFTIDIYSIAGLGRFLVGAGSAFAFVGVLKLATIWLPPHRFGMVAGLVTALGMSGPIIGDILLTPMVNSIGWRNTVMITAFAGILLAIFMWFTIKDRNQQSQNSEHLISQPEATTFKDLFTGLIVMMRSRQVWLAGSIGCCLFLPISIFAELWGIPYLQQGLNFPEMHAAIINPILFIGFSLGGIIGGWISDTIKRRREPLMLGGTVAFIAACILFYASALSVTTVCVLLFVIGLFSGIESIVFAVSRESVAHRFAGTAIAVTNLLTMLGGMIFQPVIGMLLDYHATHVMHHSVDALTNSDYRYALTVVPVMLGLSVILAFFLRETAAQPFKE